MTSPKYNVCMLCPENRYITKHHIDGKSEKPSNKLTERRTIPLCPICHKAIHAGHLRFDSKDELWNAYLNWAKKGFPINQKPFGNIWEGTK